jgi:hypothetical protein
MTCRFQRLWPVCFGYFSETFALPSIFTTFNTHFELKSTISNSNFLIVNLSVRLFLTQLINIILGDIKPLDEAHPEFKQTNFMSKLKPLGFATKKQQVGF